MGWTFKVYLTETKAKPVANEAEVEDFGRYGEMLERWWLHSCTKSGWDGSRDGHSCMLVDQARIQKTRLASRSFASRSSDSGNTFYRGTSRVYATAWAEKQDPLPERARRRQMYDSRPLLPRTKTPTSAKTLQILEPHTNTTTSKPGISRINHVARS